MNTKQRIHYYIVYILFIIFLECELDIEAKLGYGLSFLVYMIAAAIAYTLVRYCIPKESVREEKIDDI